MTGFGGYLLLGFATCPIDAPAFSGSAHWTGSVNELATGLPSPSLAGKKCIVNARSQVAWFSEWEVLGWVTEQESTVPAELTSSCATTRPASRLVKASAGYDPAPEDLGRLGTGGEI